MLNSLGKAIGTIIVTIIAGVILLTIEYWSPYFQQRPRTAVPSPRKTTPTARPEPEPTSALVPSIPGSGVIEVPSAGAQATLPLPIMVRAGQPGDQLTATLRWRDGTEISRSFAALRGEDNRGLLITSLDWSNGGKSPQPTTQSATLEIRDQSDVILAQQKFTMLSADDLASTFPLDLYWTVDGELRPEKHHLPIPEGNRFGTAALEALLWGPTPENREGFMTAIPTPGEVLAYDARTSNWGPRVRLLSFEIDNGVATADLSKEIRAYGGGATRAARIREQIERTLGYFGTVQKIIIEVEGQTDPKLSP